MNIPVGFGQCNFIYTGPGVPRGAQITFGFDNTEDSNTPSFAAARFQSVWNTTLKTVQNDNVTLSAIRVKLGPNETGAEATLGVGIAGAQTASLETPQVALLVNKATSLGGRANRGRWFLPGVRESYVDGSGIVDPSGGAAIQTQLTAFLSGLTTENMPMVVLHNNEELTPTPVTALQLQYLASTQRRRLRKVGGRRRTGV